MVFGVFTEEERAESLAKALKSRLEKAAFNKANEHKYKLEYLDSNHWAELATKWKIRMPVYNEAASEKGIRKYMRKVGVSNEVWCESYCSVKEWLGYNPTWTLYGAVGLVLELK